MSIELPVRPVGAAVEQATEAIEAGVARAGASLGTILDQLGELDLDEAVRETAERLRREADEVLTEFDGPSERERLAFVAATVVLIMAVVVSVVLVRRRGTAAPDRGTPAPKRTRKSARRRRS